VTQTTGGCSNYIRLDITVTTPPSLDLTLGVASAAVCQTINSNAASMTNNTAASSGQTTTWNYTVTPGSLTNILNYSFTFVLANYTLGTNSITITSGDAILDVNTGTIQVSGATGVVTLTASVATTTGQAALDVTGTISACSFTLTSGAGGGTYSGTESDPTGAVSISTIPSIGTIN